jgi:hypothetical protein
VNQRQKSGARTRLRSASGGVAASYHDATVRGVKAKRVQLDEIWSLTNPTNPGCAESHVPEGTIVREGCVGASDDFWGCDLRVTALSSYHSRHAIWHPWPDQAERIENNLGIASLMPRTSPTSLPRTSRKAS